MKQTFCEIALATGVTPQQVELIHQTFTARAMLPEAPAAVPEKLTYEADDYPKEERTQMHSYINGFNDAVDAMLAAAPPHSQQSAETKDLKIGFATCCSLTFDKALDVVGSHNKIYERLLSITPTEITNQIVQEVNAGRCPSHESKEPKP